MRSDLVPSDIGQRIFTFRGLQVMVDRDLAELYQVETKRLNEQVKRNSNRFPSSFLFQLLDDELNELVANCDRFEGKKWFAFSKMNTETLTVLRKLKALGYEE